jgi:hypothetical protein
MRSYIISATTIFIFSSNSFSIEIPTCKDMVQKDDGYQPSQDTPCCSGFNCWSISDSLLSAYKNKMLGRSIYYWMEPSRTEIKECYTKELFVGKIISIEDGGNSGEKGYEFIIKGILPKGLSGVRTVLNCGISDSMICRFNGHASGSENTDRRLFVFTEKPVGKNIVKSKWPLRTCVDIDQNNISIGMNEDQVIASWGKPSKINRSVGSWGSNEQWVYEDQFSYLYFENGILSSFQDERVR